jgi:hypothetical protein
MKRTRINRQAEQVKIVNQIAQDAPQTSSMFSIFKRDSESTPELLDDVWGKDARTALKIEDLTRWRSPEGIWHDFPPGYVNPSTRDLRNAFDRFKLDPDDPWSWRRLAEYMAVVVSLPQRKRGRPVEYTPEKLMQIREERDAAALKNLPDTKAAKLLAKKHAGTTRKSGAEGVRKQIRKARSLGTK